MKDGFYYTNAAIRITAKLSVARTSDWCNIKMRPDCTGGREEQKKRDYHLLCSEVVW